MKSKFVYLFLFMTLLLSACTTVSTESNKAVDEPAVEVVETTLNVEEEELFNGFTLRSSAISDDGRLPIAYTCDGDSATLPLTWAGAPDETVSFVVVMDHTAGPDDVHWYWVLYDIPAEVTSLAENSSGIGTLGTNSVNGNLAYAPPCSKGPGDKAYTYTVYALSAEPQFSVDATQVSRDVLLEAIEGITIASAEMTVAYAREEAQQTSPEQNTAQGENQPEQQSPDGQTPPDEAIDACVSLKEGDACEFTWKKGIEMGSCKMGTNQLACSPQLEAGNDDQPREAGKGD